MKKEVLIPESNVEKFEKQMEKLVKLSKKLGSEPVTYKKLGSEFKKIELDGKQQFVRFIRYTIEGEAPKLNNEYKLIARLEKQKNLNIIHHIDKEVRLPDGLEHRKNYCEHCHSKRQRKYLYILQEASTGKLVQVGKTCLKDFLGWHLSPKQVANWFETLCEIDEMEELEYLGTPMGFEHFYAPTIEIIAHAMYHIQQEGYVKYYNPETKKPLTKVKVLDFLYDPFTCTKVRKERYFEKAQQIIDWILKQDPKNNYFKNLQILVEDGYTSTKRVGLPVSAYPSYLQFIERKKQEEKKKISQYVGEIGQRKEFELKFEKSHSYETDYGEMYIYIFHDQSGNVFVWKTSKEVDFDDDDKVRLKATIKEHREYNGLKQTILTRCKILD